MKKNEIFETEITGISAEGMGVCKIEEMAVFVPSTALGDVIMCKIVKVLKKYAFGICVKVITASNQRQNCDCQVFGKCGGCVFRHINYNAESEIKETRVKEVLARIGGYKDFNLEKICSAENRNRYRNKAQIPLGLDENSNLVMGFYGKHSHRIIGMDDCLLQPEKFTKIMQVFKDWQETFAVSLYNESEHKGLLRHLYLRIGEVLGEIMVCIVINGNDLPFAKELVVMLKEDVPEVSSVVLNINKEKTNVITGKKCITIFGKDYITDTLCGLKFNISPLSFYQVNRTQAEKLYMQAGEYADLKGDEILLDLYCGAGTIGLSMSHKVKKLIGVEIIPQAIENAKINAKNNNVKNAEFICGDASMAVQKLAESGEKPDVIILDPPRKGCEKSLIETVCKMSPEKIVYISCDPATFARDLVIFRELGYILKKARPFDLFPATAHCEVVSVLEKI